jgi:hypothetical protein
MRWCVVDTNNPVLKDRRWIWVVLFFVAVTLAATSNQSFWIDEFCTARSAEHTSLIAAWQELAMLRTSELQLPFFITYAWAYEKVFGSGELAMRLASLPFFVVGMTLLTVATGRRWSRHWPVAAALGLSPFAWYYLNEARPYAMQLGAAAMVVAGLIRLGDPSALSRAEESRWLGVYLFGIALLSAISMLGEMWVGAALLAVFAVVPRERWRGWWPNYRWRLLGTSAVLLGVGCFYLWTVKSGARATAVATTNLQTILFIFYEQLGFVGPGPGRNELREVGAQALKPFLPGLAAHGVVTGLVVLAGLAAIWKRSDHRRLLLLVGFLAIPAGLILLAGFVTHFRVLGRHFAPLNVLLLLTIGAGLLQLWQQGNWIRRGIVVGFMVCSLFSSLQLRVAQRHSKEDYRQAAAIVKSALARGEVVWWNAAEVGAVYYHVPLSTITTPARTGVFICNPKHSLDASLPPPDLVAASKPDLYDPAGVLAAYLQKNRYQKVASFMAFSMWRKENNP